MTECLIWRRCKGAWSRTGALASLSRHATTCADCTPGPALTCLLCSNYVCCVCSLQATTVNTHFCVVVQTQGLKDFSNDVRHLGIPKEKKNMRQLKRMPLQAFDRLHVMKYISTRCDVMSRGLLNACIPCVSPNAHNGANALVLWLIFEEQIDFERFESSAAPRVKDWWSELVVAAHALPTTEVCMSTGACTRTCLGPQVPFFRALHVLHCLTARYVACSLWRHSSICIYTP